MNHQNLKDLTGQKFGRLTVTGLAGRNKSNRVLWACLCDCGATNEKIVAGNSLKSGNTTSCGCYRVENMATRGLKHGKSSTSEYAAWQLMRQRVLNPNHLGYADYKDIQSDTVFDDFEVFLADVGLKPTSKHILKRENSGLGYVKGNLVWATRLEKLKA